MYCRNCGSKINDKAEYCTNCGCKPLNGNQFCQECWNWFAFLFGALWALTKGVWVSPLLAIMLSFFTYGFVGFIYACICGIRGNYMYYNVYVKNKQLLI
ncbi:hypothetical protein CLRAG_03230 [Clostridium ragsdalei P11]|uniref:Double zinc ribbon n=1 Tax=Clostridium ragsdalei P11 TaxID=1353534 RepID=A0A1A6B3A3_9CLOT|nr:zinc ribbon domain-containing protein [Clostridium ragsdalei]OBR96814.1 hypothetical protein CLRAG_03230 [Clostridium ragsdalei P11]